MKTLRATGVKVVIRPEPAEQGLIAMVRDENTESFRTGTVLSMGSDALEKLPDVRPGHRVVYAQHLACTTGPVRGEHVVHWDHVLCRIEDKAEEYFSACHLRSASRDEHGVTLSLEDAAGKVQRVHLRPDVWARVDELAHGRENAAE